VLVGKGDFRRISLNGTIINRGTFMNYIFLHILNYDLKRV
jgi:hypothetical protein